MITTSDGLMLFMFGVNAEGEISLRVFNRTSRSGEAWLHDYSLTADQLARQLGHFVEVEGETFLYGWPDDESDGHQTLVHSSPDDVVGDMLDEFEPTEEFPDAVRVGKWKRMDVGRLDGLPLEHLLEYLQDNYDNPEDTTTWTPSAGMRAAERLFIDRVLSEYRPYLYQQVEVLTLSVPEWIERNREDLHWWEMLAPRPAASKPVSSTAGESYQPCVDCGMPNASSGQLAPLWDGVNVARVLERCWSCNRVRYGKAHPRVIAEAIRIGIRALPTSAMPVRY